jgi:hypothetical protein
MALAVDALSEMVGLGDGQARNALPLTLDPTS